MNLPDEDTRLSLSLRVCRIIVLALIMGVVAFGVVAIVLRQDPNRPVAAEPFISYGALGVAALAVLLQAVVPGLMVTGMRRQIAAGKWPPAQTAHLIPDDLGKLCALFQTRLIFSVAFMEGAAFFLLVAYLLEGSVLALAGAGVMLPLLLVKIPTRAGLESWLSDQQDLLRQDRMTV